MHGVALRSAKAARRREGAALEALTGAGRDGMTAAEVAGAARVDASTGRRLLRRLEAQGRAVRDDAGRWHAAGRGPVALAAGALTWDDLTAAFEGALRDRALDAGGDLEPDRAATERALCRLFSLPLGRLVDRRFGEADLRRVVQAGAEAGKAALSGGLGIEELAALALDGWRDAAAPSEEAAREAVAAWTGGEPEPTPAHEPTEAEARRWVRDALNLAPAEEAGYRFTPAERRRIIVAAREHGAAEGYGVFVTRFLPARKAAEARRLAAEAPQIAARAAAAAQEAQRLAEAEAAEEARQRAAAEAEERRQQEVAARTCRLCGQGCATPTGRATHEAHCRRSIAEAQAALAAGELDPDGGIEGVIDTGRRARAQIKLLARHLAWLGQVASAEEAEVGLTATARVNRDAARRQVEQSGGMGPLLALVIAEMLERRAAPHVPPAPSGASTIERIDAMLRELGIDAMAPAEPDAAGPYVRLPAVPLRMDGAGTVAEEDTGKQAAVQTDAEQAARDLADLRRGIEALAAFGAEAAPKA